MSCRSVVYPYPGRRRKLGAHEIDCPTCDGDRVVNGDCSCGRCESPPDVWCPECSGEGYIEEPMCDECGEYRSECVCEPEASS